MGCLAQINNKRFRGNQKAMLSEEERKWHHVLYPDKVGRCYFLCVTPTFLTLVILTLVVSQAGSS